MIDIDKFNDAVKLADKILLKRGRISLSEIRSMRQVDGKQEAIAVAQNLIDKYEELEVVEDLWHREITLYLSPAEARRARAGLRRMRSPLPPPPRIITN